MDNIKPNLNFDNSSPTDVQLSDLHPKDIRLTCPRLDCSFCRTDNFVDFEGNELPGKYAYCVNKKKCGLMSFIDIVSDPIPFDFVTSCHNCKFFEPLNQLSLFYV